MNEVLSSPNYHKRSFPYMFNVKHSGGVNLGKITLLGMELVNFEEWERIVVERLDFSHYGKTRYTPWSRAQASDRGSPQRDRYVLSKIKSSVN